MRSLLRPLFALTAALLLLLTPISQARAANPAPPKVLQTPGIDAHLGYIAQKTCSPAAKPGTSALLKAMIKTWGGASWGISRFCTSGGTSEHKEGRAFDWHMDSRKAKDRAKVDDAIRWLTANNGEVAYRLGIMYLIWNQKIWSIYYQELGWRTLADRGSWTANHKDHVHVSLSWDGAMGQTSWWTGEVLAVPQLGPCGTKTFGTCLRMIGRSSSKTWPAVAVGPYSPYPSVVPAIGGSARVGLTLRAVAGTWMPAGSALTHQWLRDGVPIPGAKGTEYIVSAADLGRAIRLRVSATMGTSTLTKTSDETTETVPGLLPTPRPTVTGNYRYAAALSGSPGSGFPDATTFAYQWQRDGKNIAGATAAGYTPAIPDVGHDLRLRVTASKAGYATVKTYSTAVEVTALTFVAAPAPSIDGILRVGGLLTAVTGAWQPAASFTFQWYRAGTRVSGRTGSTYSLTSADLGKGISLRVRGSLPGYRALTRGTERSAVVRPGMTAGTPRIDDDSPRVGQTITVIPGTWKPSSANLRYQWFRNGVAIQSADGPSYQVGAPDLGAALRVIVTGTADGYPAVARSAATKKVADG